MNWLRLWHDMPTDPKFRTIAKISEEPLSAVLSVYVFLMVDASCHALSRGVTLCHDDDISSALDLDIFQVQKIKKAMQGKLLDGNKLTGWETRQSARKEDKTALDRQHRHREKKKEESLNEVSRSVTPCHTMSRYRIDKIREDKIKEKTFMSGKPDDVPLKNYEIKKQAAEILDFLNSKTGRCYRPVETNLKLIVARLMSGASVMDCRQVIAKKTREWRGDNKMAEYLRPATLFNATKFEQYIGELINEKGETNVQQN